jgi:hypothetical protein
MKCASEGMMKIQQTTMGLQQQQGQLMQQFGLTQKHFAQYTGELQSFLQEMMINSDVGLE